MSASGRKDQRATTVPPSHWCVLGRAGTWLLSPLTSKMKKMRKVFTLMLVELEIKEYAEAEHFWINCPIGDRIFFYQ